MSSSFRCGFTNGRLKTLERAFISICTHITLNVALILIRRVLTVFYVLGGLDRNSVLFNPKQLSNQLTYLHKARHTTK